MKQLKIALQPLTGASLWATCATTARAHDGHGLSGSHWHASDSGGFVALAVLVAVAVWSSRKDK